MERLGFETWRRCLDPDSGQFRDRPSALNRGGCCRPLQQLTFPSWGTLVNQTYEQFPPSCLTNVNPLCDQGSVESAWPWSPGMALAVQLIIHPSDDATRRQMSSEEIVTQPLLQTIPSSRPEAYLAPLLLPVCCVCGLICDETDPPSHRTPWVTPGSYRRTHNVHSTDLLFTHSYYPDYLLQARTGMKEFFREQEVSEDHRSLHIVQ